MSAPTHLVFAPLHSTALHSTALHSTALHIAVPPSVDLDDVLADVAESGVSAPAADVDSLSDVVAGARDRGIDLSVIVVDEDPGRLTDLRDLATTVGESEGGTILVLSPNAVGSYSDSISRVQLETAQDRSFGESASITADRFSHAIVEPGPPWGMYTVLLVALVAVAAGITFIATWRRATDAGPAQVAVNETKQTIDSPGSS